MIKLIMSDMDGTLLSDDESIHPNNIEAINKAKSKGILFGIATGRDYLSMIHILDKYNVSFDYAVIGNGAMFIDKDGNCLLNSFLDKKMFLSVVNILNNLNLPVMIFTTDGYYSTNPAYTRKILIERSCKNLNLKYEDFIVGNKTANHAAMNLKPVDNIDDFLNKDINIIKIESFSLDLDLINQARKRFLKSDDISILQSFYDNIEITNKTALKGSTLHEGIKLLNIDNDEVTIVGDNLNDISLFKLFKHSYAPNTAVPYIKEKASKIVCSNNEGCLKEVIDIVLKDFD